jgi:uncharacterized membrane protein HdeD (DUF308 family)
MFDLVAGGLLLALGIVLIANPAFGTVAVTKLVGWVFIVSGITSFFASILGRVRNPIWGIIGGLVVGVIGFNLAFNPLEGSITLTFLFTLWLFFEGAVNLFGALTWRGQGRRGILFAVAALNIIFGLILWSNFPTNAAWLLGVLAGLSLMMRGAILLLVGGSQARAS